MSIKIFCHQSESSAADREYSITLKDIRNQKQLKSVVISRLSDDEDVTSIIINGYIFQCFEDLPIHEWKSDVLMKLIIGKKMKVVQNGLLYDRNVVTLTSNGKNLNKDASLLNQGIRDGSRIGTTVRSNEG